MAKLFFTTSEQARIVEAIRIAELNTSGEIRVHIEAKCEGNPYDRATILFDELGMQKTNLKNGVLFYLAYLDKKFAIIGDSGIHEKVSQKFWDEEKELMVLMFKKGEFVRGLELAIEQAGEKLKFYFPHQKSDTNELNNEISFGNNNDSNHS